MSSDGTANDRRKDVSRLSLEALEPRVLLSASFPTEMYTLDDGGEVEVLSGSVLVGFRDGVVTALGEADGQIQHRFRGNVAEVAFGDEMSVKEAVDYYGNLAGVAYVEPNYIIGTQATTPDDPRFDELWGLHNTGQTGGTADADIDAPEAWDITTGSSSVIVGVIDTGIDYTHPDLVDNMWVNPGETPGNGVDDDGNGYVDDVYGYDFYDDDGDPMDEHSHGTHVAGTIGAVGDNGLGVTGVAWDVSVAALRFLGPDGFGATSDALEALEYATMMGFDLTNNSWGGGGFSQAMRDAIVAARDAGQLFVAAAGNSSTNNDMLPHYPSSYDVENVIAVASTDHNDELSGFSNYGVSSVDLGAPGSSILSTVPGGGYSRMSGTSMATPHVSGVLALMWSHNPGASTAELKDALLESVDPLSSLDGLVATGGRLNAYSALESVRPPVPGQDLYGSSFDVVETGLSNRPYATLSYRVSNVGDTDIADSFEVEFVLSENDVLGDADDVLVDSVTIAGLDAGGDATGSLVTTGLPGGDPFGGDGSYRVFMNVDANDDVPGEYDEANNVQFDDVSYNHGLMFYDNFSADGGWTGYESGRWERGPALAGGGQYGYPDPGTDATPMNDDDYLLGYNIGGDYENSLAATQWITSPVIDLSGAQDVELSFQRWLNVEAPFWDDALVQVYGAGSWHTVWQNDASVQDNSWVSQQFDVSAWADGETDFRIRFGMGPTDSSWRYSGWNLDEVMISGLLPADSTPPTVANVEVLQDDQGRVMEVLAQFSELMDYDTLTDLSNYALQDSLSQAVAISDVMATGNAALVQLGSALVPNVTYTLTINGDEPDALADTAGNLLDGDGDGIGGDDFTHMFALPGVRAGSLDVYGGRIIFYDTDATGQRDLNVRPLAQVRGSAARGITSVVLQEQFSPFGVVILQQPGSDQPISVIDRTGEVYPISYIVMDGNAGVMNLRSELAGHLLNGTALDGVSLPLDIDADGDYSDHSGLVVFGDLGRLVSPSDINGDVIASGEGALALFRGDMAGDLIYGGSLGAVRMLGGPLNADVSVGGHLGQAFLRHGSAGLDHEISAGSMGFFVSLDDLGAHVDVAGDFNLFRIGSGDFEGSLTVGGRLNRLITARGSEVYAPIEAGEIGAVLLRGSDGVVEDILSYGDVGIIHSMGAVGADVEVYGDLGRLVALGGTDYGFSLMTSGDAGLFRSNGDVLGPVYVGGDLGRFFVTRGDLGEAIVLRSGDAGAGDVVAALQVDGDAGVIVVNGGSILGGGVIPDGESALRGGLGVSVGGDLSRLLVRNPGEDAITGGVEVGGEAVLLNAVGDVEAGLEFGSLRRLIIRGDFEGAIWSNSDLDVVLVTEDFEGELDVDGNMRLFRTVGSVSDSSLSTEGDWRNFTVLGDLMDSSINSGGELRRAFVRGDYVNTNMAARTLNRVVLRGSISAGASQNYIRALSGSFGLLAEGQFNLIDSGNPALLGGAPGVLAAVGAIS